MNDFFAAFGALNKEQVDKLAMNPPGASAPAAIALLAQAIASEDARIDAANQYVKLLRSDSYKAHLEDSSKLMETLGLLPPVSVDLSALSMFSFYLRFEFKLETAYISRDDRAFSINENPVRKDHVFETPMISPTSWKGALKSACRIEGGRKRVDALFGTAPDETEEAVDAAKGRLHFYPTFFSKVGLEAINPHDRRTRTGKNPIRIECVPRGSLGTFAALYAPIEPSDALDAAADVRLITRACRAMLMEYGFAAKKSSGYGAAADQLGPKGGRLFSGLIDDWQPEFQTLESLPIKGEELAQWVEAAA